MKKVFFISSRLNHGKGLLEGFSSLLKHLDISFITENKQILIKTHFGEDGNTAYLNPLYVRKAADFVKSKKAHPFVGDTSTLYRGRRNTGVSHLELALEHGFSYASINAPIVILDGLKSDYIHSQPIDGRHFKEIKVAGALKASDGAIILTHVKGHMLAGMGGAIKNLSMGFGTRVQKQRMHGDVKPKVNLKKCIKCKACIRACPVDAIDMISSEIVINLDKCVGCAECIIHCPTSAINILWNESPVIMAEKMAETALGAVQSIEGKMFYFNFLINITPDCDCLGASDNPIVNDIGLLASDDPVAIDQASYDLICQQKAMQNSVIEGKEGDIFRAVHPNIDALHQIEYAEKIGLGVSLYELIRINS